jgi:hypothetical protein
LTVATTTQLSLLSGLQTQLSTILSGLEPADSAEMQTEMDGVNAQLESYRNLVAIALAVAFAPVYTDAEKVQLITETLGPQP